MTGIPGIEEVTRLLQSGQSLAEVRRQLLPEPWQRALRACAVAEVFTADLFDSVLRDHAQPEAPSLADLEDRRLVEPVPGDPPSWRVPREDVPGWMADWTTGRSGTEPTPQLVEVESQLARWHEQHGDRNERLRHLMIADLPQATSLFLKMFGDADDRRDFACCQDLLDILGDPNRITLAGPTVSELRLDRAGYLRSRLYWSTDYSRSAQFLMPPGLVERTDRLLSGSGPPVWQLYAPGGTGKTMQLQWLVARRCATAAVDIPCARIDFDVIDPVNVARHPWLLLLEAADQFERRWPRRVFERLDSYAPYRTLSRRMTSELTREAAAGLAGLRSEDVERRVTEIFVRRFNGASGGRPIVLIVDTLEEVMLGSGQEPDRLLQLLARLVRDCPDLRLVLAGRYDLRERAPEAMADLGPTESVELTDFTREQASAYLGDIRGIADAALRDVVMARTGGQPFLVALYGDVIEEHPDISPADLARQGEPATQLLIDRVIRRVADPDVRWLVRYGVVPRRLRYDDVATVMWPFVVRGRAGPSDSDDPRQDRHHLSGNEDVFPFGTPPQEEAERAAVWNRLLSYAARPSWVSPADDGQSVLFHPNVRAPMRDLISQQPVFRELHEAFRCRFENLAEANPAAAPAYLREAIYHRIQMADPGIADFWRAQIIRYRDSGDLDAMDDIAGELLREDYTENGLPQLRSDGQPVLPYELLIEALVLQGYVAAERARAVLAEASDPLWSAVQRSLASAAFVRDHAPGHPGVSSMEVALQAALLIMAAQPAQAIDLAERALVGASSGGRIDLLRVLADAQFATGDPSAEPSYRSAFDLAAAQGRADQQDVIALALASLYEAQGHLDRGIKWAERPPTARAGPFTATERALLQGRLLIECYVPAAALRSLAEVHIQGPTAIAEIARLRAHAYLMLGREDAALGELDAAAEAAERMPGAARYTHLAQTHQLRAVVLGGLLAVEEAEDSFQLATSLWAQIGFSDGHPECSYLYRSFLIRHVGDLAAAALIPRPPMGADSELALHWDEQTAELHAAQATTPRRDRGSESDLAGLPPRQVARIIAARLARSWPLYRDQVPELAAALEMIHPVSARLLVLDELRRCEQADPEDIRFLREVLSAEPDAVPDDDDAALQHGLLAELERLGGQRASAHSELVKAEAGVPSGHPGMLLGRWRYLQARSRAQAPIDPLRATELLSLAPDRPLLRAAIMFVLATAPASRLSAERRRELLERAVEYAEAIDRPTRWGADIFWAAGERFGGMSMLAMSADIDEQLGRQPRLHGADEPGGEGEEAAPDERGRPSLRILADRPGERAIALPPQGVEPANLEGLQRRIVTEWPSLARGLGRALFGDSSVPDRPPPELTALRLESADVTTHALPWELAVPPSYATESRNDRWRQVAYRSVPAAAARIDTRWLQRALCSVGLDQPIDGVVGPLTLDALHRLAPEAQFPLAALVRTELAQRVRPAFRRPRPVVVVLRPEAAVESKITSHWDSGFDAAHLYAAAGFRVQDVTSLADVAPAEYGDPVRILHVTARMDFGSTGPFFDFSAAELQERLGSKARGTDVHPKNIVRWLRGCVPGQEPLVVLDPPYPGSPFDLPWQLVLRNLFAALLFSEAAAPAIIATGVQTVAPYIGAIALDVAAGRPLAEIASGLRPSRADGSPGQPPANWALADDELAARATAIFAAPSAFTLTPEDR